MIGSEKTCHVEKNIFSFYFSVTPTVYVYCIAGNIGGELNLADWWFASRPPNKNPPIMSFIRYRNAETAKLKSAIFDNFRTFFILIEVQK